MTDSESKARAKLEEAEKKSKKVGGILGFFGAGNNATEAAELFIQAANLFKVAKNWTEAGNVFVKVAELYERQGDAKHDSAMNYNEAGNCFRKVDAQKSVDCFHKTTEIYTDMGRFNMAAKVHTVIAELFESEGSEKEKCMNEYQRAADFFKGEEAKSSASKCLVKVAQIAAELEQYEKAVELFEEIAIYEADHPTLKYAAKTHFFQALLCYFCIDLLETQRAMKRYEELSPSFTDSRECKFLKEIYAALEGNSVDNFTESVQQYDKISRFEPWYVSMLVKIKRRCVEEEEDLR